MLDKKGIEVNMSGAEFYIRTTYSSKNKEGLRVIDMPYLESNSKNENLLDGSIELTN